MEMGARVVGQGEIVAPCADLPPTLAFLEGLGFRIETLFPAEGPTTAVVSGHGLRLRLEPGDGPAPTLRLQGPEASRRVAPNGLTILFIPPEGPIEPPPLARAFHLVRGGEAQPGRAGMLYRDLIPSRLGGRYVASHIQIPDGGPVSDWVHHHRVRVQFLYCRSGEASVVYEDQGEPLSFAAGDLILQPPHIRHRVLSASAGFEVVEIAAPALHETLADWELSLPNRGGDAGRAWAGQRFLFDRGAQAVWAQTPFGAVRETGLNAASGGLAQARVYRIDPAATLDLPDPAAELRFGFVLSGAGTLTFEGAVPVGPGDAFTLPAAGGRISSGAQGLELLWVCAAPWSTSRSGEIA